MSKFRIVVALCLSLSATAAAEDQIDNQKTASRVDLDLANQDVPSALKLTGLGGGRVLFPEVDAQCPQVHWTFRATAGSVRFTKAILARDQKFDSWPNAW